MLSVRKAILFFREERIKISFEITFSIPGFISFQPAYFFWVLSDSVAQASPLKLIIVYSSYDLKEVSTYQRTVSVEYMSKLVLRQVFFSFLHFFCVSFSSFIHHLHHRGYPISIIDRDLLNNKRTCVLMAISPPAN
jgi:hypothetical protein